MGKTLQELPPSLGSPEMTQKDIVEDGAAQRQRRTNRVMFFCLPLPEKKARQIQAGSVWHRTEQVPNGALRTRPAFAGHHPPHKRGAGKEAGSKKGGPQNCLGRYGSSSLTSACSKLLAPAEKLFPINLTCQLSFCGQGTRTRVKRAFLAWTSRTPRGS